MGTLPFHRGYVNAQLTFYSNVPRREWHKHKMLDGKNSAWVLHRNLCEMVPIDFIGKFTPLFIPCRFKICIAGKRSVFSLLGAETVSSSLGAD